MNKDSKAYNQCNDSQNTKIGMCVDGTTAREHKAAPINGNKSGKEVPSKTQGTK